MRLRRLTTHLLFSVLTATLSLSQAADLKIGVGDKKRSGPTDHPPRKTQ